MGSQEDLNVAILVDGHEKGEQWIKDLCKAKLLKEKHVLFYASFIDVKDADVEDMFESEFLFEIGERGVLEQN